MKFVDGVFNPKEGKFVSYELNDFLSSLKRLCDYGFDEFKEEVTQYAIANGMTFEELMSFEVTNDKTTRNYSLFVDEESKNRSTGGWGQMNSSYFGRGKVHPSQKLKEIRRLLGYRVDPKSGLVKTDHFTGKPETRHINCYISGMPMVGYFINKPGSKDFDESMPLDHVILKYYHFIPKGGGSYESMFNRQNVDTMFKVTQVHREVVNGKLNLRYEGHLDLDGHLSNVLDHFYAEKIREAVKKAAVGPYAMDPSEVIALIAPEQRIGTGIIDKLRQQLSYKSGRVRPIDMKNAIKAMIRDLRQVDGDLNRQIQTISRVKIVTLNTTKKPKTETIEKHNSGVDWDALSRYYSTSHFFNWFDRDYRAKSWSDVFSSQNKAKVDQYTDTILHFGLGITFISEKTMTEGIFCLDNNAYKEYLLSKPEYAPIVKHTISDQIQFNTNVLSHVFMRHGDGISGVSEEIISIATVKDEYYDSPLAYMTACKKWNQRKKTVVCDKFPVNYKNGFNYVTKGEPGFELKFRRDINGLSYKDSEFFKKDRFHVNALVGFFEGDFELDAAMNADKYSRLNADQLEKFHKKLDGVSCDGWFTKDFLHQIEIVPARTFSVNCKNYELSENMLEIIKKVDDLGSARSSDPVQIEVIKKNYRSADMLAYYSVECPICKSRMAEGDSETGKPKQNHEKKFTYVRPESLHFACPLCEHFMDNPSVGSVTNKGDIKYHEKAVVSKNYITNGQGKFNRIIIKGYKPNEEGLDLKVDAYYDWANARTTGPDIIKVVVQERADNFVGMVKELKVRNPETGEWHIFKNVQLDGLISSGANKAKEVGIMNAHCRMTNLVCGRKKAKERNLIALPSDKFDVDGEEMDLAFDAENIWYPNKYISVNNPDFELKELNEKVIQHMEKVEVVREVWNPDIHMWEERTYKMYVGIAALNATEVSQENNSVYPMENPAKLSLNDSDHLHQLGFTTLIKQLYAQNRRAYSDNLKLVMDDEKNFDAELLQILGCLLHPVMNNSAAHDINEEEARRYIRDLIELKKSVKLLNPGEVDPLKMGNLTVKDFEQDRENRVALTNWLTYEDYKKLERRHPLFREQPFLNGNYSKFTFTRFVEVVGGAPSREEYLYYIRWPSSQLMHSLVDLSADGLKVRFDDIYVAFLNLFENISTSKLDTKTDSTQIEPPLLGPGGRSLTEAPINMLKKAILDYFLTKEGAFTQNLSLNLPGIGSKQTGSPLVPSDVVIVPDDQDAKRVLTDVYHTLYPESNADWKVVYGDDGYEYVGSSWTSDYYGIAHRDPAVWRNQNYVCRIWTRHRANIEFMKMYGKTYDEMFPGCTSILVNSVRAVEDQESDFDGDFERIGIAYLQDVIPYMKEYIEEAANNGFFRNDEFYAEKEAELRAMQPVPLEKLKRVKGYRTLAKMARNVRFSYLWDESKTLYYKYPEKLNYNLMRSKVSLERENIALLEAVEAKNDIGMLTNSMRQVNYVVDYLKNICEERPEELPFYISDEDQSAIIFIFQYLLLQRNGVRAVKADGSYGKLTFPALITNEPVRVLTDNEPDFKPARELFKKMLKEFDDEFHTELSNHYQIIIDICENFMISDIPGEGGGYKQVQVKGKADPFGRTHIVIPDAENIEPRFRNVMGLWYLISGSSYESFVGRHGEDALFRGIYDNTLSHVPQLKQVGEDLKHLIRKEA